MSQKPNVQNLNGLKKKHKRFNIKTEIAKHTNKFGSLYSFVSSVFHAVVSINLVVNDRWS